MHTATVEQSVVFFCSIAILTRVHRARQPPAERPPCTQASHPEGGNHPPSSPHSAGSAAQV
jgi:hypothetical protein